MQVLVFGTLIGLGLFLLADTLMRPRQPLLLGDLLDRAAPLGAGLAGGVVGWLLTGWPVAVAVGAIGGALLPRSLQARLEARRRAERSEALAAVAAGLRDAVRGGLGISEAISGQARWGPPELRAHLGQLAAETTMLGLPEALAGFARRLGDPLADLLAATLALNARLGGRNLADVLDALTTAVRAEAHTLREIRARQAQQRLTARIVAAAPLVIVVAIRRTNPAYLAPFSTPTGQAVLVLAALLVVAGYTMMVALSRPAAGTRLVPKGSGR
jgi:Flp pilus assembly protein TadB